MVRNINLGKASINISMYIICPSGNAIKSSLLALFWGVNSPGWPGSLWFAKTFLSLCVPTFMYVHLHDDSCWSPKPLDSLESELQEALSCLMWVPELNEFSEGAGSTFNNAAPLLTFPCFLKWNAASFQTTLQLLKATYWPVWAVQNCHRCYGLFRKDPVTGFK